MVAVGVQASGVGEVGVSGAAECADDDVAECREVRGGVFGAGLAGVFCEGDVADVVGFVLHGPVVSGVGGEVGGSGLAGGQGGDPVDDFFVVPGLFAGGFAAADDLEDLCGVGEVDAGGVGGADFAAFATAVAGVGGVVVAAGGGEGGVGCGEAGGDGSVQMRFDPPRKFRTSA